MISFSGLMVQKKSGGEGITVQLIKPGVIKRVHAGKILLYTVHSQNRFSHYGFTFLYLIKKQSVEDGLNGENEPFRVFV